MLEQATPDKIRRANVTKDFVKNLHKEEFIKIKIWIDFGRQAPFSQFMEMNPAGK